MSSIHFKAIPTFRILDYQLALDFYLRDLGFEMDWEHRFGHDAPVYMQISKNNLTLHLSENERFTAGMIIFIDTTGIHAYRKELLRRNPSLGIHEIEKTAWNTLQMEIEDPFGNVLRFNQQLTDTDQ
ncbi:MAG: glyoxalase superfamily protein [Gracilimonas sp.]|jgi:uncharacterized glyoxalase superfamily protein PhnB|nr:glyoxalase superfamily protein [Gracilimonas sp.]